MQIIYFVVVGAIWAVDIGLGSQVVELLARVAGCRGWFPVQAYIFIVFIYFFFLSYYSLLLFIFFHILENVKQ